MFELIEEKQNVKTIKISLPHEFIDRARDKVYTNLSKDIKVKGFRPGMVPRNMLNTIIGMDRINEMIKDEVADSAYDELVKDEKFEELNPMLPPVLDSVELGGTADVKLNVHAYPVVEIESLEGEEIEVPKVHEEDLMQDVDRELDRMREENAILNPKEEGAEIDTGDSIEIEYTVQGNSQEAQTLELIVREPEEGNLFAELVGKKAGDSFTFEDKSENTGNTNVLEIKVNRVYTRVLPEVNDDFAKTVDPETETLDALREKLYGQIKASIDQIVKGLAERTILERLEAKTTPDISEDSLTIYAQRVVEKQKETKEYEKTLKEYKGDEKTYFEAVKAELTAFLKLKGAIEKLSGEKGIEVSEEEIFEKAKQDYENAKISDDRLKVMLSRDIDLHSRIKDDILYHKVAVNLLDEVKLVEIEHDHDHDHDHHDHDHEHDHTEEEGGEEKIEQ